MFEAKEPKDLPAFSLRWVNTPGEHASVVFSKTALTSVRWLLKKKKGTVVFCGKTAGAVAREGDLRSSDVTFWCMLIFAIDVFRVFLARVAFCASGAFGEFIR